MIVDFDRLDYEQILNEYNVRHIRDIGDWIIFSCPFSEHKRGDKKPSAGINLESGGWNCFGCGRSGTIINFVAEYEGITLIEATEKLQESYGGLFGDYSLVEEFEEIIEHGRKQRIRKESPRIDERVRHLFDVDWARAKESYIAGTLPSRLRYPFLRRIEVDSLYRFGIGFDQNFKRLTIPWRDKDGNLVGFRGRATSITDFPKYVGIGDKKNEYYGFPTLKTSHHVFGLDSATQELLIVEGEFDCISLRQRGFEGAVALGGSKLTEHQLRLIEDTATSVSLMFDPDNAGKEATRKWADALFTRLPVTLIDLGENDPAESTTDEIYDAVSKAQNALERLI